jgi:hypothetical protein
VRNCVDRSFPDHNATRGARLDPREVPSLDSHQDCPLNPREIGQQQPDAGGALEFSDTGHSLSAL